MSKYIIEIPDNTRRIWIDVFGDGYCYTRAENVDDLEELNRDYINEHFGSLQDEAYQKGINDGSLDVKQRVEGAYQRGYDEGYKKCLSVYDFDQPCISCEGYKRGLNDAWEAAKRIFGYEIDGGIPINKVREAFGYAENAIFCTADIIRDYTAQEAIDKIKAYDGKHTDRIEVGDEEPCLINEQTRQALNNAISVLAETMDKIREKLEVFNG